MPVEPGGKEGEFEVIESRAIDEKSALAAAGKSEAGSQTDCGLDAGAGWTTSTDRVGLDAWTQAGFALVPRGFSLVGQPAAGSDDEEDRVYFVERVSDGAIRRQCGLCPGIYECPWSRFSLRLPGHQVFGSGVSFRRVASVAAGRRFAIEKLGEDLGSRVPFVDSAQLGRIPIADGRAAGRQ